MRARDRRNFELATLFGDMVLPAKFNHVPNTCVHDRLYKSGIYILWYYLMVLFGGPIRWVYLVMFYLCNRRLISNEYNFWYPPIPQYHGLTSTDSMIK